jgi:hypothetical protein
MASSSPEHRLRVCLDACEQHHAFRTRWWLPNEVELVRRSDLVEVVLELVRWGIPRSWLKRQLWHAVPRAGYWPGCLRDSADALAADASGDVSAPYTRPVGQLSCQASAAALGSAAPGWAWLAQGVVAMSVRRRPRVPARYGRRG